MNCRKRVWSPSTKILVSKNNYQKFRDLYSSEFPCHKKLNIGEIWAFCTICSKNLNIAHSDHNDCAHHKVANSHLEFEELPRIVCK